MAAALAPSDVALFADPEWTKGAMAEFPAMFAHGLEGYTDDRLADGAGWVTELSPATGALTRLISG